MNLDQRQITTFEACIAGGSLTQAARTLHITLAAASLRIKALESNLGQRLLVRGKVLRATPAGQALLAHIKRVRLLEADLTQTLHPEQHDFQALSVAVNADSIASWFLDGVCASLKQHRLTIHAVIDDQGHTLDWLKNGDVIGCVTTLAQALRGCVAEPLGVMRYRCVAAPTLATELRAGEQTPAPHRLLKTPAISFNRKDTLQDQFLQQHLGVTAAGYPRHYLPAVNAFRQALLGGLGWGMDAQIQHPDDYCEGRLVDLFPGLWLDVPLYWQHWLREPPQAARLTKAILAAAKQALPTLEAAQGSSEDSSDLPGAI